MAEYAEFEFFDEPIDFSFEDIEGARLEAFIIAGIVNPFGPTLSFVASVGLSDRRPIISAMLNPFSCEVRRIGTFVPGDQWYPLEEFKRLSGFIQGSCPTFVLLNAALAEDNRQLIAQEFLESFEDAAQSLEPVREFYENPMDRVSASMGIAVDAPANRTEGIAQATWAQLLLDGRHIWPEIRAFLYAWDGSINQTGISGAMKSQALDAERMKSLLVPMLQTVWLPDPDEPSDKPPPPKWQPTLEAPEKLEDVREMLVDHSCWTGLKGDDLLQFLGWAMLLYGRDVDSSLIGDLSSLYEFALGNTDPEHRLLHLQNLAGEAERYRLAACTFLPPLIVDTDQSIVSSAAINLIALSLSDENGLPAEFIELDHLFERGAPANPGAVLGGLTTMGDRRFHPKLHRWKGYLDEAAVAVAARCQSPFVTHGEVLFWLDWAQELIDLDDPQSEGIFGLIASALARLGQNNPYDLVQDVERQFPAYAFDEPVSCLAQWKKHQYAHEISERLYRCENYESAPKVFSAVLRTWGLEPKADLMDQFIPDGRALR